MPLQTHTHCGSFSTLRTVITKQLPCLLHTSFPKMKLAKRYWIAICIRNTKIERKKLESQKQQKGLPLVSCPIPFLPLDNCRETKYMGYSQLILTDNFHSGLDLMLTEVNRNPWIRPSVL